MATDVSKILDGFKLYPFKFYIYIVSNINTNRILNNNFNQNNLYYL